MKEDNKINWGISKDLQADIRFVSAHGKSKSRRQVTLVYLCFLPFY